MAAYRLVLPGEVAPGSPACAERAPIRARRRGGAHRVDGERTIMHEGDFIITPPMAWHDHGNESDRPIFWLDGLDIPIVQFLDASFAEHLEKTSSRFRGRSATREARFGSNLLPVDYKARTGASPVFNYPYARTRESLERMRRAGAWDPCHGLKMRYTNPATGGYPMTTIAAFIQLLPKGFATAPYRSTDATVFVAVEGRGRTRIGADFIVEWQPRDIFVVPSWKQVSHDVAEDAVLFSFSDRPDSGSAPAVPRGSRQCMSHADNKPAAPSRAPPSTRCSARSPRFRRTSSPGSRLRTSGR